MMVIRECICDFGCSIHLVTIMLWIMLIILRCVLFQGSTLSRRVERVGRETKREINKANARKFYDQTGWRILLFHF